MWTLTTRFGTLFKTEPTRPNSTLPPIVCGFQYSKIEYVSANHRISSFASCVAAIECCKRRNYPILSLLPSVSVVFSLSSIESSAHNGTVLAITQYNTHS